MEVTFGEALQVILGVQEAALYRGYVEETKIVVHKTFGEQRVRRMPVQYVTVRKTGMGGKGAVVEDTVSNGTNNQTY